VLGSEGVVVLGVPPRSPVVREPGTGRDRQPALR